jgi:hypothetical protein
VSSAFDQVCEIARTPLVCYLNADIILLSDFIAALRRIDLHSFLLCGQRWDLNLDVALAFDEPSCEPRLRGKVRESGKLHSRQAMDYFAFPRGEFVGLPPFAVGRAMWDNWLVFGARSRRIPVIDATAVVTAIHQNHDYSHRLGGVQEVWYGPEARQNRALAADMLYPFTIDDATLELLPGSLAYRSSPGARIRQAQAAVALQVRTRPRLRRMLRRVLRAKES